MILCLLYERTGSLYPSMALHALNNSIAFGAGDGRGWLVPVCLAGAAAAITALARASGGTPAARSRFAHP
jgi:membrane protease YdiL (CAAX protease family)